jgi:hypothetical protein
VRPGFYNIGTSSSFSIKNTLAPKSLTKKNFFCHQFEDLGHKDGRRLEEHVAISGTDWLKLTFWVPEIYNFEKFCWGFWKLTAATITHFECYVWACQIIQIMMPKFVFFTVKSLSKQMKWNACNCNCDCLNIDPISFLIALVAKASTFICCLTV